MSLSFIRLLILTLLVTFLTHESEGKRNKRWIQSTGFGGSEGNEGYELNRRDVGQSQQTQQQSGQDKDKLQFPEFPQEDYERFDEQEGADKDRLDQQQPSDKDRLEEQRPSDNDRLGLDQQRPSDKDNYGQDTETIDQNQVGYGQKGSYTPKDESYKESSSNYKPWYKHVGSFFKKHYSNVKDAIRGKRDDYYYSE